MMEQVFGVLFWRLLDDEKKNSMSVLMQESDPAEKMPKYTQQHKKKKENTFLQQNATSRNLDLAHTFRATSWFSYECSAESALSENCDENKNEFVILKLSALSFFVKTWYNSWKLTVDKKSFRDFRFLMFRIAKKIQMRNNTKPRAFPEVQDHCLTQLICWFCACCIPSCF